jgi:hypothetical protein
MNMSFDPISAAKSTFGNIAAGVNAVSNVASALNNLSNPGKLASAIRSLNIPKGGNSFGANAKTIPTMASDKSTDWRVRLTLPGMDSASLNEVYGAGTLLQPIRDSGGLIFPYTPTISISHSATYGEQTLTHQNYQFTAYQNSKVSDITVNGEFIVQDWVEAKYWIAALHFLRSVTKMYAGDSPYTGNPPPILKFNGYGDYVFKNVPVVVKSFSVTLNKDCDYISVDVNKPAPGESSGGSNGASKTDKIGAGARLLSGVANAAGFSSVSKFVSVISQGALGATAKAKVTSASGGKNPQSAGGGGVAPSHVPTNSSISVVLMPVYSRTQVREFNLKTFVTGGYKGQMYL